MSAPRSLLHSSSSAARLARRHPGAPPIHRPFASSSRLTIPSSQPPPPSQPRFTTINAAEISHFTRLASEWWSETGEFALLHRMNPARIEFIRQRIALSPLSESEPAWTFADRARDAEREAARGTGRWLAGRTVLDVGCGGGLLSEALARLGGDVLGVDAGEGNVGMARAHAAGDPFLPYVDGDGEGNGVGMGAGVDESKGRLRYRHTTAETLRDEGHKFDVVCSMEVVEHVDEPAEFMKALGDMVKPGGHLILSTISRTPLAELLTITLAERVLRLVTPGTHTYSKYITPRELRAFVGSREMGGGQVWEADEDGEGRMEGLAQTQTQTQTRRGSDLDLDLDSEGKRREAAGPVEIGETRGIVYVPWRGEWTLLDKRLGTRARVAGHGEGWGKEMGEMVNYMYGARKRADAPV